MQKLCFSSLIVALGLCSCTASDREIALFSTTRAAVTADIKERLAAAEKIASGGNQSAELYMFLSRNSSYETDGKCSTTKEREFILSNNRWKAFKTLTFYFDSIKIKLDKTTQIAKVSDFSFEAIGAASSLVPVANAQALTIAAKSLVDAAIQIGRIVEGEIERQKIAAIARKRHKEVVEVVNNLAAGLKSLNDEANANLKLWEQCEVELVFFLRDNHEIPIIELETRFRSFQKTRDFVKALAGDDPGKDSPLLKLIEVHRRLFDDTGAPLDEILEDLKSSLRILIELKQKREDASAALKALAGIENSL